MASHLSGSELAVMVVRAGASSDTLNDAAESIGVALKSTDQVKLVMDDAALGNVSDLDDSAIVEKAGAIPVDRVVVVRVVDGSPPTAIISMYSKEGEAKGGFTASAASPVAAKKGGGSAADSAVGAVMADAGMDKKAALEKFLAEVVWFQGGSIVDASSGAVVGTYSNVYKGRYQVPLNNKEFYTTVGNEEALADWQRNRKIIMYSSGALIAVATPVTAVGIKLYAEQERKPLLKQNLNKSAKGSAMGLIGGACILLGGYGLVAGEFDPRSNSEKRELAHKYNQQLLKELGLTESDLQSLSSPYTSRRSVFTDLRLAPYSLPGGAGAGLSGEF